MIATLTGPRAKFNLFIMACLDAKQTTFLASTTDAGLENSLNNTEPNENEQIILADQDSDWKTRKRKKQERMDRARREERERQGDDYFPMYYTLRFPGTDIDTSLRLLRPKNKSYNKPGGDLDIKQMNRYTLLLKTNTRQQGRRILQITEIAGKAAVAKEHQSLNQSKGTVHGESFGTESIQRIKSKLES